MACGLVWSPQLEITFEGVSDLLEESSSILEGPGPRYTGLLTLPMQVIGSRGNSWWDGLTLIYCP